MKKFSSIFAMFLSLTAASAQASSITGSVFSTAETVTKVVESVINTVLSPFGTTTDVSTKSDAKHLVMLAKQDAKAYLLGGEMTEKLAMARDAVKAIALEENNEAVLALTDLEMAREIYIFATSALVQSS